MKLVLAVLTLFCLPMASAQESDIYDVYGIQYKIPAKPEDLSVYEEFQKLSPELQLEIQNERREIIYKFLRALTITSPIAKLKEHFRAPTLDTWIDENRMLSEYGHFADRNPNIGTEIGKGLIEKLVTLLNNRIWSIARIRGDPGHYKGKVQIFFLNAGALLGNSIKFYGLRIPTSFFALRSIAAYTFFDHTESRWRTLLYFHKQSADREKVGQFFVGTEVGYRVMQVYTLDPGLDPKGKFISFPGTPVTIEGERMAGIGVNLSLNLLAEGLVLWSIKAPGVKVAAAAAGAQFVGKVGIVQANFENKLIGELPSFQQIWSWIEKKTGLSFVATGPKTVKEKISCAPSLGLRNSILGLSGY